MINKIEKWEDAGEWTKDAMKGKPLSPYLHALFFAVRERYHHVAGRWNSSKDDIEHLNFLSDYEMMQFIASTTEYLVNCQKYTSSALLESLDYIGYVSSVEGLVTYKCVTTRQNILDAIGESEWYDLDKKKLHFLEAEFFIFYRKVLDCMTEVFLRKYEFDRLPQALLDIMWKETSGWQLEAGPDFFCIRLGIVQYFVPENFIYISDNAGGGWVARSEQFQFNYDTPEAVLNAINQVPQSPEGLLQWSINNPYYSIAKSLFLSATPEYYNKNYQSRYQFVARNYDVYRWNKYNEYHWPGDEWMPPENWAWRETGFSLNCCATTMTVPEVNTTYVPKPNVTDGDYDIKFYNFICESYVNEKQYNGTSRSCFKFYRKTKLSEGEEMYYAPMYKTYLKYSLPTGLNWNSELARHLAKRDSMEKPAVITTKNIYDNGNACDSGIFYSYAETFLEVATYQPDFKFKSA